MVNNFKKLHERNVIFLSENYFNYSHTTVADIFFISNS
jgi:hypothetical protein